MIPVIVIVGKIVAAKPLHMTLIPRNHVVEQFATHTVHSAFRDAVLPGVAKADTHRPEITRAQEGQDVTAKLGIMVEQNVFIRTGKRKGFTQLLHDPIAGGMNSGVELQNPPLGIFYCEETVQPPKRKSRNREEVKGADQFPVIIQEREPLLSFAPLRKSL